MAGRKETVSDEEILDIFIDHPDPVLTTSEVANELDFTLTGARKRLYELEEAGQVRYKKSGNTSIWWIVDQEGTDER